MTTYWSRQSLVILRVQLGIFCSASGGRPVCVCLPSPASRSSQPWKRAQSFVLLARFLAPIASSLNPQFRHSSLQFSPAGESVFGARQVTGPSAPVDPAILLPDLVE